MHSWVKGACPAIPWSVRWGGCYPSPALCPRWALDLTSGYSHWTSPLCLSWTTEESGTSLQVVRGMLTIFPEECVLTWMYVCQYWRARAGVFRLTQHFSSGAVYLSQCTFQVVQRSRNTVVLVKSFVSKAWVTLRFTFVSRRVQGAIALQSQLAATSLLFFPDVTWVLHTW